MKLDFMLAQRQNAQAIIRRETQRLARQPHVDTALLENARIILHHWEARIRREYGPHVLNDSTPPL